MFIRPPTALRSLFGAKSWRQRRRRSLQGRRIPTANCFVGQPHRRPGKEQQRSPTHQRASRTWPRLPVKYQSNRHADAGTARRVKHTRAELDHLDASCPPAILASRGVGGRRNCGYPRPGHHRSAFRAAIFAGAEIVTAARATTRWPLASVAPESEY